MEFHYESIQIQIKDIIKDMNIIKVTHREYRKDNTIFFSRMSEYNQLGFVFNNSFHLLKKYMKCIICYSNYDNDIKCNSCGHIYSKSKNCFFLNCKTIVPLNIYNELKKQYNLNTLNEYYYDQRHKMHSFLKEEIIASAFHPHKIKRILELTNNDWSNLSNCI